MWSVKCSWKSRLILQLIQHLNLKITFASVQALQFYFLPAIVFSNLYQILTPQFSWYCCFFRAMTCFQFPISRLWKIFRCRVSLGDGWGGIYGAFTSAIGLAQLAHWPSSLHDTWRWSTFRLWSSHRRWTWCAHHRGCGSISWGLHQKIQVQVVFGTSKGISSKMFVSHISMAM